MSCLVGGVLLVYVEFCRPGWVLFGAAGGVLAVVGGYHLVLRGLGWGVAALALCWTVLALAAFGAWPRWLGWLASATFFLICSKMEAHPAIVAPLVAATWWLLAIAGRALQNKSGLE